MRVSGITFVQGRNGYADPDGRKYGIAIHNTSNNASASAEASYATRRTDGTSSHFYCDGHEVIQSLDTSVRAGHAGSSNGNNHAVAVEITGVNSWNRQQWLDRVAWTELGRVLAQVCKAYGISDRRATVAEMIRNPKVQAFYGHDDMRRAWGGTTHTDPGPGFPWDKLFAAVNAALNPPKPAATTRKDDDMLMLKLPGDATIWLSRAFDGTGVHRVALAATAEMPAGVPLITVANEARLTLLGGPERTSAS
jgi:N-acetyl-anhydromuramyl-L-alanine amidase AmpD